MTTKRISDNRLTRKEIALNAALATHAHTASKFTNEEVLKTAKTYYDFLTNIDE